MCKECAVKSINDAKMTMTSEQQELTDNLAIVYFAQKQTLQQILTKWRLSINYQCIHSWIIRGHIHRSKTYFWLKPIVNMILKIYFAMNLCGTA